MTSYFSRVADRLAVGHLSIVGMSKSARLVEDLGLDSVNLYELALDCEDEFGIDIPTGNLKSS